MKNSLYDSYVRALRWASDRINGRGVVGFATNGSFIEGNAMDGLRASITGEFSAIYIFNLRGNQRTSGEISRMEGAKSSVREVAPASPFPSLSEIQPRLARANSTIMTLVTI